MVIIYPEDHELKDGDALDLSKVSIQGTLISDQALEVSQRIIQALDDAEDITGIFKAIKPFKPINMPGKMSDLFEVALQAVLKPEETDRVSALRSRFEQVLDAADAYIGLASEAKKIEYAVQVLLTYASDQEFTVKGKTFTAAQIKDVLDKTESDSITDKAAAHVMAVDFLRSIVDNS